MSKHVGSLDVRKDLRVRGRVEDNLRVRDEVEASAFYIRGVGELTIGNENIQSQLDTAQATTSGTAFDFTSPFSTVEKIEVLLNGVDLSGTDNILVQIGTVSGGIKTSGYVSSGVSMNNAGSVLVASSTAAFVLRRDTNTDTVYGIMTIEKTEDTDWVESHSGRAASDECVAGGGTVNFPGDELGLNSVRLTRSGTDTFSAGTVNVRWWGTN